MQLTSLFKILAVAACLAVAPTLASAQAYPTRAIKIIVPAPPGGAIDMIARVVGDKLPTSMGQPVIVDNRPGASNNLGTDVLAKSAPDGYTIGIVGGSHNINKFLFKNLRLGSGEELRAHRLHPRGSAGVRHLSRRFPPRRCPSSSPG